MKKAENGEKEREILEEGKEEIKEKGERKRKREREREREAKNFRKKRLVH